VAALPGALQMIWAVTTLRTFFSSQGIRGRCEL
jgi:hypothetical protein